MKIKIKPNNSVKNSNNNTDVGLNLELKKLLS